ncbi:hypothetical protein FLLO111716_13470 [Flavobacterium longum]|uniref:LysM peptidoglycan-binding domain-containing protein n=1 Tax=Flavobacterium longum TaxID=1299340 RepID=UPI0039E74BE3
MKRFLLVLLIVFSLQNAFAQEFEMIRHQVQLGETVRMISRKYKIEPAEIYRLNKFAIDGISQGMVLQLMVPKKEEAADQVVADSSSNTQTSTQTSGDETTSTTTTTKTTTTVRKKKTTEAPPAEPVENQVDPDVQPVAETTAAERMDSGVSTSHTVAKGETLFSIARRYGVSVDAIKQQNESILKRGLQPGQVLSIGGASGEVVAETPAPKPAKKPAERPVEKPAPRIQYYEPPADTTTADAGAEVKHKVEKGETLYSLSRKYNVSVDDIKSQNEDLLKKGLQIGQVLTIRTTN